jgi:hypothetical protein
MKHTNYLNLLNIITTRNKGFWRLDAINRLSRKINQGQTHLEYLKNLITRHEKQNQSHSFLQINSVKTLNKRNNQTEKGRSKSSQTFFVTQIPKSSSRGLYNNNYKLFLNEYEENMYNPIELYPFEIKYTRQRDENQIYFNVQEIKKEIEKNYNYIRSKQIKERPFSSSYKNKMDKNLFSYENKSHSYNISMNNYYSNNHTMSQKRRRDYKINFISNKYNSINSHQIWKNSQQKKRIISAYLRNKRNDNILGEENELFDKIKKNKALLNKLSKKNKTVNNYSTMTDNSNGYFQKKGLSNNNINKKELYKNILNSAKNDTHINMFFDDIKYRNNNKRKIKSAKIDKNLLLKYKICDFKHNFFSNLNRNNKNKDFHSLLFQNEKNNDLIKKKSKVLKI